MPGEAIHYYESEEKAASDAREWKLRGHSILMSSFYLPDGMHVSTHVTVGDEPIPVNFGVDGKTLPSMAVIIKVELPMPNDDGEL